MGDDASMRGRIRELARCEVIEFFRLRTCWLAGHGVSDSDAFRSILSALSLEPSRPRSPNPWSDQSMYSPLAELKGTASPFFRTLSGPARSRSSLRAIATLRHQVNATEIEQGAVDQR